MQFRLTYEGPLKANGDRRHKHRVRQVLHPQLAELWDKQSPLAEVKRSSHTSESPGQPRITKSGLDLVADEFRRVNFRFAPIVTRTLKLVCGVEILFLRRENPGDLIRSGGDIDNRIKTLFDALRMPSVRELEGFTPQEGEDPFYCLLEDDSLIVEVKVTTDRLLAPLKSDQAPGHVLLVVAVSVRPTAVTIGNLGY